MDAFPHVAALKTREEFAAHAEAMRAQGHSLPSPTHAFRRDGAIVGGVSLGGAVAVLGWFDPQLRARDTAGLINAMENALRLSGAAELLVPVALDSPLLPHMPALGYVPLNPVTLFHKRL